MSNLEGVATFNEHVILIMNYGFLKSVAEIRWKNGENCFEKKRSK